MYSMPQGTSMESLGVAQIKVTLSSKLATSQLLVEGKSLPIISFRVPQATV